MKTTKVFRKIGIPVHFFLPAAIMLLLSACDVLESDSDVLVPDVDITGKEIYVLTTGESFIDLQSKIQTNQPARLAVTSTPRHGTLKDLGKGMLQYSPATGGARARDGFEFTVYSASNEIIKKDSVIIIIENDSTNLPCNLYPVTDYVYDVASSGVTIDVLVNDIICSNDVVVSVHKPENSFPPYFGTAEVKNNKVIYYPGASFSGSDKIMYKISSSNPERIAYGLVYITSDSSCTFSVSDDLYVFNTIQEGSTVALSAFDNDSLCQALNQYQVNVRSGPFYGQAALTSSGFSYLVPDSVGVNFSDYFLYEMCIDAACKTARVDIKVKQDSVWTCTLYAASDSIDISKNISGLIFMEVVKNDSICGDLTSFVLTSNPKYGTAYVNEANHTIAYQRDPLMNKDDGLEYKICNSNQCSTASVFIKRN
jgi:hypothetical protein